MATSSSSSSSSHQIPSPLDTFGLPWPELNDGISYTDVVKPIDSSKTVIDFYSSKYTNSAPLLGWSQRIKNGQISVDGKVVTDPDAGTGNPFFTTDTVAALRCAEINAEVVLKATNVDGVYGEDPKCNPNAHLLDALSYQDVTTKDLSVMDMTAITLCQENNIPVVVFNLNKPGNIAKAITGERVGTIIGPCDQKQRPEGNVMSHDFGNGSHSSEQESCIQ